MKRAATLRDRRSSVLVVSLGCPCGVGPEVAVAAVAQRRRLPRLLVGDFATIVAAAQRVGVPPARFEPYTGRAPSGRQIAVLDPGPRLSVRDRRAGRPTALSGRAQLSWVDAGYDLVRAAPRSRALVTGPVNKAAIAHCGAPGAARFRGHTEWLEARDGAGSSVMCFTTPAFATSLVTTHLPISRVPRRIEAEGVRRATVELARLLRRLGKKTPRIVVTSLNPHAGEGTLLGREEERAIVPGITLAKRDLGRRARIEGPTGAETAYRRAASGAFDGVVAMYHDQATIPTKLLAFGDAVNVTQGLSIVRTSVDHGTGYDIAWRGAADPSGMRAALDLAERLLLGPQGESKR